MSVVKKKEPYMGMISWSKTQCGAAIPLYGSDIGTNTPIRIQIKHGGYERERNHTWYLSECKPIIEVAMTPVQWAEFLTNGNCDGVPCTLTEIQGEQIPWPKPEHIVETFSNELVEASNTLDTEIANLANYIKTEMDSGKPMGKGKMAELLKQVQNFKNKTVGAMECVKEEFAEAMEQTVTNAKAEISAYAELKLGNSDVKCIPEIK